MTGSQQIAETIQSQENGRKRENRNRKRKRETEKTDFSILQKLQSVVVR